MSFASGKPIEALERRTLFAAAMSPTLPNTLIVEGTTGNDLIGLRTVGDQLRVVINGVMQKFATANVTRIEIYAGDGHDIADWSAIAINTYINAGIGNDSVVGGAGNDTITGAAGKDTLRGGPGDDRINGAGSIDILYGDAGSDVIYGGAHDDYAEGGEGTDWIFGEDGNDRLIGGLNNDRLYGGGGADRLYGLENNDLLNGEGGNDRLYGGHGNDNMTGGPGADQFYGEIGNDTMYARDGVDDLLDGGSGTDSAQVDNTEYDTQNVENIDSPTTTPPPDPEDPPPLSNKHPVAISFNDEALWPENFNTAVAEAKKLGVSAVRLWVDINDYNDRPTAWDTIDYTEVVKKWIPNNTDPRGDTAGLAVKRAFDLYRAGFDVLLTVNRYGGEPPASAAEVTNFYTHMMNTPEVLGSSTKLKDAVDWWQVGNEVDYSFYWKPSGDNLTNGLKAYVDQLLIPAANVLHSGPKSQWEPIISGSVRWNPNDLNVILKQLQTRNRLDAIDFAGYHPYGIYDASAGINEIAARATQAKNFAAAMGKNLVATEWNVRGYPNNGSRNNDWGSAVDYVYKNVIRPNFEMGFYYALVNNHAARGGNTTARPASALKHDSPISVTTGSSVSDLLTYYRSPLVKSEPFYSVIDGWL